MNRRQIYTQLNQHSKIPPWPNGVVPIKMSEPIFKEQMAYFITDDNTTKGRPKHKHQ